LSLWRELKKRSVFKVGVAYAIVAWLLVQVADIFFPALQLPDWSVTLVAGLVILGLPVALILAWAYEITPGGIRPASEVAAARDPRGEKGQKLNYAILVLVLLGVLLLVLDRYAFDDAASGNGPSLISAIGLRPTLAAVIPLTKDAPLASGVAALGFDSSLVAVSPRGDLLVYVGRNERGSQLYLRPLDAFTEPEALPGTEGAVHAFFSPDGTTLGFLTDDKVRRLSLQGGEVRTVATARLPVRGFWGKDDWLFILEDEGNSVGRVRAGGGQIETMIRPTWVKFSDMAPDGQSVVGTLILQSVSGDYGDLVTVDLKTGQQNSLGEFGYDPRWLATGRLLFGRDGSVFVLRLNAATGGVEGEPVPVLRGVAMDSLMGQIQLSVAANGLLAYVPGSDRGVGRIVRVDSRNGVQALPVPPQKFSVLDLSPDDRQLAIQVADVRDYVWIYDLERAEGRKLPGSEGHSHPKFSRDGTLAFTSLDMGESDLRVMVGRPDGPAPELFHVSPMNGTSVSDWSNDGRLMTLNGWPGGGIRLLTTGPHPEVRWLSREPGEWGAVFSPDDQWLAYTSNESGRNEIWVRPVSDGDGRRQLSAHGGIEPVWCPCGRVFYRRGDQFFGIEVDLEGGLSAGPEEQVFTVKDFLDTPGRSYDVSSDGATLYTVMRAEPAIEDRIHVIANWPYALAESSSAGGP